MKGKLDPRLKIIIVITAICMILLGLLMGKMIIENGKCMDDPFRYSARQLSKQAGYWSCTCNPSNISYAPFSFDEEGIKIIKPLFDQELDPSKIDVSKLNISERR